MIQNNAQTIRFYQRRTNNLDSLTKSEIEKHEILISMTWLILGSISNMNNKELNNMSCEQKKTQFGLRWTVNSIRKKIGLKRTYDQQ